jgi:hypothetical protein
MQVINSILKALFHQMVETVVREVAVDKETGLAAAVEEAVVEEAAEEEYFLTVPMLRYRVRFLQMEDHLGWVDQVDWVALQECPEA